jgi:hypothetical protein
MNEEYAIMRDGSSAPVERWPRTVEGAITATNRAARLSRTGAPTELRRPDGRLLGRWVGGRRADLPPGGIVHLAEARAAAL